MEPNYESVDSANNQEVFRILSPANNRTLMRRRWEFVCELFDAGKSYAEIGKVIERAESTVRRLHEYGRKQRVGWVRYPGITTKRYHRCLHCLFYESFRGAYDYRCQYPSCHLNDFTTNPVSYCNWFVPRSKFNRPPTCLCPETKKKSGHDRDQR